MQAKMHAKIDIKCMHQFSWSVHILNSFCLLIITNIDNAQASGISSGSLKARSSAELVKKHFKVKRERIEE